MEGNGRLRFDVAISGGGFAGVYAAKTLGRILGKAGPSKVVLVSEHNFMTFQPMLAEVCGSSLSPRHVVNPLRALCRNVTVLRGSVAGIDHAARQLTLRSGCFSGEVAISYQHLLVAMGGVVNLSQVPGMAEHALVLKNVGDAMRLRHALIARVEEAQLATAEVRRRLLTFVVVGGGYSGVETAGQLMDLLQDVRCYYPILRKEEFHVILIHLGKHLLPEISEDLGIYCEQNMRRRGIELLLEQRVTAMTSSRVHLENDRTIDTHFVVSTVGNAPNPLLLDLIEKEKLPSVKGRILTDPTLRVCGHPDLWAAGDCAAVPMRTSSNAAPVPPVRYCPPTAQFAFRQGELVGANIAHALAHKPAKPFTFTGIGELASIGHRTAVAQILGMKFSGFIAWFMWRTIYLMKLPGLDRKLRVMIDWTLDLFFRRDITIFEPNPTEILQEMHFEPGDCVFHRGEPATSFYIVKSGRIDLRDERSVVKTLRAGEYFGERALLQDKVWRFRAVAAEPTTLVALDSKVFFTLSGASDSLRRLFEHSATQYATREQIAAMAASIPEQIKQAQVGDVMCKTPVVMHPEMSVAEALQLMAEHPYTSFPLIDGDSKPVGLINQNFLYDALKEGSVTANCTLADFRPATFAAVTPDTPVPEAVERFVRTGRHKLLVCDNAGALKGILTPIDLLS